MSFIDFIKKLIGNNKKTARIIIKNLIKTYGTTTPFEVGLYDGKTPLADKILYITINGMSYQRKTDENGIAKLNINLNVGEYPIYVDFYETEEYNPANAYATVYVKTDTRIEGTNINKTASQTAVYQCAIYDKDNNRLKNVPIDLTINNVTYNRTTNQEDGLARLNIRLGIGNYTLTADYKGNNTHNPSSTTNTITVTADPTPTPTPTECPKPYTSTPHPTNSGCNGMGQNNSTCCGPSSLHKCLYKFGIRDITQGTLSSWAGTTSGGTSHSGLESAIAMVNKTKGTNIKIQWYNFSDLGWEKIGKILCQPNKAVFCHILYKNGGTCEGSGNYGHYETLVKVNTDTKYVKVINSLGGYCGSCYCGFYQDRTMACQEQFMRGISQKSIAVLTKN